MTWRAGGIAGIVACVAALAWYLGSPLFIRTTANEAFPSPAAAGAPSAALSPCACSPALPVTIATGQLGYVDAIHNGTGHILLLRTGDEVVLRFEDVAITNAPDVHVYLSRETGGRWTEATSLYVGPLKATNGSFNYPLTARDVGAYASVVVWCRQFSVLVSWADLH